ncbi:MAG: hypothetical protein IPP10_07765 [Candidatus Competibacteraceae bacterium]|nr:hypothetical protein [Candidatus Competibacteraceae bacterium]
MGRPRQHRAPTDSDLWPLMRAYLDWTRMTGSAKDTHRRRESALRRFSAWCEERDLHRPAEITRPILERYQRQLRDARKPDGQTADPRLSTRPAHPAPGLLQMAGARAADSL